MSKPEFVYVIYIAATPEKVFEALTDAKMSERYWHGNYVESDWKVGSPFALRLSRRDKDVTGKVLEYDPPRRLALSWRVDWLEEKLPDCIVSYDLTPMGEVTKLTMTEHHPTPIDPKWLEGGKQGWPMILSGLKSLLETGAALPIPTPKPQ